MHCNVGRLVGHRLAGTDGEVGKVTEFYFDARAWIITYLVVRTGNWLSGRKLLISPCALTKNVDRPGMFPADLSLQQIRNSPDIDPDLPVSRQQELTLHRYFSWQNYWSTDFYTSGAWGIVTPDPPPPRDGDGDGDSHLRSIHAATGYHIETADGQLGHLRDFIVDDETWRIEFMVVEMYSWLTAKRVLIARRSIKGFASASSKVLVDVTSTALENRPRYDDSELFLWERVNAVGPVNRKQNNKTR